MPIRLETRRFPGGFEELGKHPGTFISKDVVGEPQTIDAPDLQDPLFVRFINCTEDIDYLKFIDRFGDEPAIRLSETKDVALIFSDFATAALSANVGEVVVGTSLNNLLASVSIKPTMRRIDGADRLVLNVSSALDFMKLEIAAAVDAGATLTTCQHCGRNFLFGPLTGRRSHAKYCLDRCRVAAMRARNLAKVGKQ